MKMCAYNNKNVIHNYNDMYNKKLITIRSNKIMRLKKMNDFSWLQVFRPGNVELRKQLLLHSKDGAAFMIHVPFGRCSIGNYKICL